MAEVDYFDLGVQHFLIMQHVPDSMAHRYPTRDRHTAEQEADFIRGYEHAKRESILAKEATGLFD